MVNVNVLREPMPMFDKERLLRRFTPRNDWQPLVIVRTFASLSVDSAKQSPPHRRERKMPHRFTPRSDTSLGVIASAVCEAIWPFIIGTKTASPLR
jgi:hypothetical protein